MSLHRPVVDAVLIGAGSRGTFAYGTTALAHPAHVRFVAVAEPDPERRARFANQHALPPDRCFASWEDLLAAGQLAPALVCCTLDRLHVAPTVAALEAGYHVLLEKPMAVTPEDCVRLVQTSEHVNRVLMICHVLRYTSFFSTLYPPPMTVAMAAVTVVSWRRLRGLCGGQTIRRTLRRSRPRVPPSKATCWPSPPSAQGGPVP